MAASAAWNTTSFHMQCQLARPSSLLPSLQPFDENNNNNNNATRPAARPGSRSTPPSHRSFTELDSKVARLCRGWIRRKKLTWHACQRLREWGIK